MKARKGEDGNFKMEFKLEKEKSETSYGFELLNILDMPRKIMKQAEKNHTIIYKKDVDDLEKELENLDIDKQALQMLRDGHNFKEVIIKLYENSKQKMNKISKEKQKIKVFKALKEKIVSLHKQFCAENTF